MTENAEKFWEGKNYLVITDSSKPAIKMTIDELKKRGMSVQVINIRGMDEDKINASLKALSLPIDKIVIGITKMEPALIMNYLIEKGCKDIWVHWRTDTEKVRQMASNKDYNILIGKCPMLYLGKGVSIHGVHRLIARSLGKY
jgi:predicted CoA-binding protein